MMEKGAIGGGVEGTEWLWGAASAAQLGWGVRSYSKGYAGDSRLMPIKAFAVASLFVGSAASASVVLLRSNGIHKVDDLMEAGANLRAKLGLPPRTQNKTILFAQSMHRGTSSWICSVNPSKTMVKR